jgi:O-antigen/teichoic acid export membrane protein
VDNAGRSGRIVVNTFASYGRLAISAFAGLFTIRVALHLLGVTDYGIFSVIAGTLSFLAFLNGALTAGAQRHVAYSLGLGRHDEANRWFSISVIVHFSLGLILLGSAGLLAHWTIYDLLKLPAGRLHAAMWIYYLTIFAMFCDIVSTPFHALLTARESIVPISLIAAASSVALCLGTLCLYILPGDKLLWYSGIYVFCRLGMLLGPVVFCLICYQECRNLQLRGIELAHVKQLLGFSAWTLFGALSGPVRAQAPAILLNRFIGPVANAAYGVAMQVNGFTANIGSGLLRATSPAIVKFEAGGNRGHMIRLSNLSSKYAFAILWLGAGPVIANVDLWLRLWLLQVPPHTGSFAALLLIALLVDQLTSGFMAAVQAHGQIAVYQILVSSMTYSVFPLGYLFLRSNMQPASAIWAVVIAASLAGATRLSFVSRRLKVSVREWMLRVLFPNLIVVAISSGAMRVITFFMKPNLLEVGLLLVTNAGLTIGVTWLLSTPIERAQYKLIGTYLSARKSGSNKAIGNLDY